LVTQSKGSGWNTAVDVCSGSRKARAAAGEAGALRTALALRRSQDRASFEQIGV